jgi:hypothetical protein
MSLSISLEASTLTLSAQELLQIFHHAINRGLQWKRYGSKTTILQVMTIPFYGISLFPRLDTQTKAHA